MTEYLIRASLEYTWDWEKESEGGQLRRPWKLPVDIGPFQLDQSPNIEFYLAELELYESERTRQGYPDRDYPVSLLYVEKKIQVPDKIDPRAKADEVFESLECLLRLFHPGEISVRRHNRMWKVEGQKIKPRLFFGGSLIKPITATLYKRPPYPLDDDVLTEFTEFFNKYWDVLQGNPSRLTIALTRFNSSYERLSLADRLVDLVIASEAIFGDGDSGSISYKVATRCACWLHQPGKERLDAFNFIRKIYNMRSTVVHGGQRASPTEIQLDELEGMVRSSLVKFLDSRASGDKTPDGKEIDSQIMTGRI